MTVIKIWSEYRYNSCSEFIEKAYEEQQFDHYFLCKPDIPWEFDPLRENPDNRDELFELYHNELLGMNRSFTILEGSIEERLKTCKETYSNEFQQLMDQFGRALIEIEDLKTVVSK
jgi:nicotinamide riboside kinase